MSDTRSYSAQGLEQFSLVVVGHVDHGKSTLVGRLLADAGALPEGKLEAIREACIRSARPFEYAFLLDALKAEQAQGITIDICRTYFKVQNREYTLLDAPGHVDFLKNMITGAAHAEGALLVIDAQEGVQENSRRHAYLLSFLGIRQFYVVINKLDKVGYAAEAFNRVVAEYSAFLAELHLTPLGFIPVAALHGENLVHASPNLGWYAGPTVLAALAAFQPQARPVDQPLRLPVQDVYKFTAGGDDRRIIAGRVESGVLRPGLDLTFYPSGQQARVSTLEAFAAPTPVRVEAGCSASFTVQPQVFVARGDVAAISTERPPQVSKTFATQVFWMGRAPLRTGKRYKLKLLTQETQAEILAVERVFNAATLTTESRHEVHRHEAAQLVWRTLRPLAFETPDVAEHLARFVIVDGYEIAGGGLITEVRTPAQNADRSEPVQPAQRMEHTRLHAGTIGLYGPQAQATADALEHLLLDEGRLPLRLPVDDLPALGAWVARLVGQGYCLLLTHGTASEAPPDAHHHWHYATQPPTPQTLRQLVEDVFC